MHILPIVLYYFQNKCIGVSNMYRIRYTYLKVTKRVSPTRH